MRSMQALRGSKHKAGIFALMFAACLLLFLPGCRAPFGPQDTGTGSVSLRIEMLDMSRAIMPTTGLSDFGQITAVFTRNGHEDVRATVEGVGSPNVTATVAGLAVGPWTLTVTAYLAGETAGDWLPAAETIENVEIVAGVNTIPPIVLEAIQGVGYGTFSWNIVFPDIVDGGSIDVLHAVGAPYHRRFLLNPLESPWVSGGEELLAGNYFVVITLNAGGDVAVVLQALHVYRHMDSHFLFTFVDDDFEPYVPVQSVTIEGLGLTGFAPNFELSLMAGGSGVTLTVVVYPSNATSQVPEWYIYSGDNYVYLDGNILTALAAGEAVVTATVGGVTSYLTVTVEPPRLADRLPGVPGDLDAVRAANADDIAWDMRDLDAEELMAHFAGTANNRMVNFTYTIGDQAIVVSTNAGLGPGGSGGTHDSQGWGWAALTIIRPNMNLGLNYVLHITGRIGNDGYAIPGGSGPMGLWPDRTATMYISAAYALPSTFTIEHVLTAAQAGGTIEIRWNLHGLNPLPETFAISIDDMVIVSVEAADYQVARAALGAVIASANLRVLGGYTSATWTPFASALAAANTAMAYTNVDAINTAYANLSAAMDALVIDAHPAWVGVLASPFVTGIGGGGAWDSVTSVTNGLLIYNRGANNQGLGIDVLALRAAYPGSSPAITITGRMSTADPMRTQGMGAGDVGSPTAGQWEFVINVPYANAIAIPDWAAWATMPWITNADGVFGDFLVTRIQVGTLEIQDLLPEFGTGDITIGLREFINAAGGISFLDDPAADISIAGGLSIALDADGLQIDEVIWVHRGVTHDGDTLTLAPGDLVLGTNSVTLIVDIGGNIYSRIITFRVTN